MDYRKMFDSMFPGFFRKPYILGLPADHVFTELAMDLRKRGPESAVFCNPGGITFGEFRGDPGALREAVRQVDEDWVQYFREDDRVFCAMDGSRIAAFCILSDWGVHQGLRIGGPGCVGTVPAYRRKGIGLELVRQATELQRAEDFDISWIHYTHLDHWYTRLGYRTVLKWNRGGFVSPQKEGDIMLKIAVPTNNPEAVSNYLDALAGSGACGEAGRDFSPEDYDGLLLPGGCDVNPSRYGKTGIPEETTDDDLDALQFAVLDRFLKAGKPILGICRGHQLLNVAFGGTLIQHLPGAEKHVRLPGDVDNVHAAHIAQDSFLYPLYGPECSVNSSHHQAIEHTGKGLRAVMYSGDGVIEAAEHDSLPVWSVQWHPERMCFRHRRDDTVDGSLIFRFFLDQCLAKR